MSILCLVGLLTTDLWAHRMSGPYAGYRDRYSDTPVVEKRVQSGPYEMTFCAFDMGHEVHMIAYARFRDSWSYYQDMIRVSVADPDGNAMTIYRDDVTEVIDEPFQWAYRRPGLYTVTVDLLPRAAGGVTGTASFTMPLARKSPTPIVLTSAAGVVMATTIAVVVLKRRRQRGER